MVQSRHWQLPIRRHSSPDAVTGHEESHTSGKARAGDVTGHEESHTSGKARAGDVTGNSFPRQGNRQEVILSQAGGIPVISEQHREA
jgi:hypothetical protein